jgi:hypothetical protein
VSAVEEASGEGEGVGVLDLSNSGGIDSKGLGGPRRDMVRNEDEEGQLAAVSYYKTACEVNPTRP